MQNKGGLAGIPSVARLASTSGPDHEGCRSHQLTCHSLHPVSFLLGDKHGLIGEMAGDPGDFPTPIPSTPVCPYPFPRAPIGSSANTVNGWLEIFKILYESILGQWGKVYVGMDF